MFTIELRADGVPQRVFEFPVHQAGQIFFVLRRMEARWRIRKEREERDAEILAVYLATTTSE
jgi:hypothetical protein